MDLAQFGMTRRPFRATPDIQRCSNVSSQEAAFQALRYAFNQRAGLALLDGAPGLGKTFLAHRFLHSLPASTNRVLIPASRFSAPSDLFQAILFDLGKSYGGMNETELRLTVSDHLLSGLNADGPTVIVLDEAQHLNQEILEEIRLLGNLENRDSKAAFVLLVALPGLRERIAQPEYASLSQRISIRCRLEPLSQEEATSFLATQIESAGGRAAEFASSEAMELMVSHSHGIPRILNQIASLALNLTINAEESQVDVEAVLEALKQLGIHEIAGNEPVVLPHQPVREPAKRRKAVAESATGRGKGLKRKSA